MRVAEEVRLDFSKAFPAALAPYTKAPQLSPIGNIAETQRSRFVILDFPESEAKSLISWATPLVKRLDREALSFSYFELDPRSNRTDVILGVAQVTIHRDGTIKQEIGLNLEEGFPKPTFDGKPIEKR